MRGVVRTIAAIASDRKQARSIFRFTIGLLRAVPMLAAMIEDDGAEAIVLNNGVVIEIHTASFRVTRGYTFAAVLADETAFWRMRTARILMSKYSERCVLGCRRSLARSC
jgi:hypothetical protein